MSPIAVFVRSVRPAALACAVSAVAAPAVAGGGSIRALPCGETGTLSLTTVNSDGSVFAGMDWEGVFRWTDVGGIERLGYAYEARGISDDGNMVVGYKQNSSQPGWQAFRWTPAGGMQNLGSWPKDPLELHNYYAMGVTADGTAVVGHGTGYNSIVYKRAFRWSDSTGMVALGVLDEQAIGDSLAAAVTPDGTTIVGSCSGVVGGIWRSSNAVRWGADGVAQPLATEAAWIESGVFAVGADGRNMAGYALDNAFHAIRWDADGNAIDLGLIPGASSAIALGISGDGSMVVGQCPPSKSGFSTAFVWTEATGILPLTDFLMANGIDTSDWDHLITASAISRNGRVIVGEGSYQGCTTSFIVDLGTACPADLDGNGAVTGFDLGLLLSQWGAPGSGDLDGSGDVGGADLGLLLSAWGPCSGG
jgi:probable HAF family extracellular repeat protein